jgi:hypothetical protein
MVAEDANQSDDQSSGAVAQDASTTNRSRIIGVLPRLKTIGRHKLTIETTRPAPFGGPLPNSKSQAGPNPANPKWIGS